ncbi:MAG: sulfurtransferase TusA family protein [Mogibacterium sp.]|jgi:TusA-related sulfurtransferase|nr:sulfurtransferase TusA family protein [Mogibacterium sp.]
MVDARGQSCPIPVIMTKKAMKSNEDYYEVMVDSKTPCENVTRFAQSQGYKVEVEDKGGEYLLKISR